MLFEETTRTLFCGDLFSQVGEGPAVTTDDIVERALQAEEIFQATALSPATAPTIRKLASLEPAMLAVMHGSSSATNCSASLERLAAAYESKARNAWTS